jgi:hypothetical protein
MAGMNILDLLIEYRTHAAPSATPLRLPAALRGEQNQALGDTALRGNPYPSWAQKVIWRLSGIRPNERLSPYGMGFSRKS